MQVQLQDIFSDHRHDLIRWFTKLTHDPQAADDLAQETLVEAWKNQHKLIDPDGAKPWINAIAANIYKRWCRQQGQEQRQIDLPEDVPSASSVEIELEQSELVSLLDQALDLLPPETQALLTARYLEGLPYTQLARLLGTTENVVAVRLHRGKVLLRELMEAEQGTEAWQPTRMWCMSCGCTMYDSKFNPSTGELHLRCVRCMPTPHLTVWSHTEIPEKPLIQGIKTFKPAMNRLLRANDLRFRPHLGSSMIPCEKCGHITTLHRDTPPDVAPYVNEWIGVRYVCEHCGQRSYTALSGIAISTEQGQAFRQAHARTHLRPIIRVEHEGRDALVLLWQSLASPHQLAAIFAQDTYALLSIQEDMSHE